MKLDDFSSLKRLEIGKRVIKQKVYEQSHYQDFMIGLVQ